MTEPAQAIAVTNLHKRFGPLEVLKGVSLTANEGDVIAIIGGSGSGKSTFLRCINLLEIADITARFPCDGELIADAAAVGGKECPRQSPSGRPDSLRARHGVPERSISGPI
jgi:ABC-type histidine transport system ATPase subunit